MTTTSAADADGCDGACADRRGCSGGSVQSTHRVFLSGGRDLQK